MKKCRIVLLFPNGCSLVKRVNVLATNTHSYFYHEKIFNNLNMFIKKNQNAISSSIEIKNQYRKKYF